MRTYLEFLEVPKLSVEDCVLERFLSSKYSNITPVPVGYKKYFHSPCQDGIGETMFTTEKQSLF